MKTSRPLTLLAGLSFVLTIHSAPALQAAPDEKPRRKEPPKAIERRSQDAAEHRERGSRRENRDVDLERHLEKLQARVKELVAAGKREEAENLERHIRELRDQRPTREAAERGHRPELEKRLAGMKREIAALDAAGKHEAAERIEVEARRLLAELEAARPERGRQGAESKAKLHAVRREIEELHRAGKHEEAERLELRLRHQPVESERPSRRHETEEIERQSHRLENLHRAIDHLREAGALDLAAELTDEAKAWEKRLARLVEQRVRREKEHHARMAGEVAELRELVGDLREQVEKLTRRLEERPRER